MSCWVLTNSYYTKFDHFIHICILLSSSSPRGLLLFGFCFSFWGSCFFLPWSSVPPFATVRFLFFLFILFFFFFLLCTFFSWDLHWPKRRQMINYKEAISTLPLFIPFWFGYHVVHISFLVFLLLLLLYCYHDIISKVHSHIQDVLLPCAGEVVVATFQDIPAVAVDDVVLRPTEFLRRDCLVLKP